MLAPGTRWFDDWYALSDIAPGVTAIGEPHYHQLNWNYLICGSERALLFDTGPGVRDIAPVVAGLTALPVIAMPSHLHFDHTGNLHRFADLAMADLPILRACEAEGIFHAPEHLYLGSYEDMTWKPVRVARWWPIGHRIDLGGRRLDIIQTPGHSPDSVSLFDTDAKILFAADFLYLGRLNAQDPGSSLPDYLTAAEALLDRLPGDTIIVGAHGKPDERGLHGPPIMTVADLRDLVDTLRAVRSGRDPQSLQPDTYPVSARLTLLVGPEAYWP
jgi:glyoxylase-like metal-dependent hydrolase (beta-lactamase superfamily II)